VQIERIHHDVALETAFSGDLVDAMVDSLLAEDPGATVLPYTLSGGTDNKSLSRLGITGYGFAPLRLPADLDFSGMFHGVDERVPVDALRFGTRVLDRLLRTCGRGRPSPVRRARPEPGGSVRVDLGEGAAHPDDLAPQPHPALAARVEDGPGELPPAVLGLFGEQPSGVVATRRRRQAEHPVLVLAALGDPCVTLLPGPPECHPPPRPARPLPAPTHPLAGLPTDVMTDCRPAADRLPTGWVPIDPTRCHCAARGATVVA
jgi:hypothetical protein